MPRVSVIAVQREGGEKNTKSVGVDLEALFSNTYTSKCADISSPDKFKTCMKAGNPRRPSYLRLSNAPPASESQSLPSVTRAKEFKRNRPNGVDGFELEKWAFSGRGQSSATKMATWSSTN